MTCDSRILILLPLVLLAVPVIVGFTWPGTVEWLTGRGVKQYRAMDFDGAAESFGRALEHDADNSTLLHNRATALHQQQRLDEAAEDFIAAAEGSEGELPNDALYGLGNTLYRGGDYAGAIDAYRDALRINPSDGQAKFNLEMAQRMQDEQQQQPPPRQDEDQEQDEQTDPEQDEGEPDPQQAEDDRQQPDAGDSRSERQQQTPEPADEDALTAEQARRLLRALASEDAQLQKIIRRQEQQRQPRAGEKDW